MTKRIKVFSWCLEVQSGRYSEMSRLASLRLCILAASSEQPQIDLKDGLEQTHIRTLIQSNLVFPDDI